MKAVLEFNIPDEAEEFRVAVGAPDAFRALEDVRQFLRGQAKYTEPEQRLGAYETYDRFFQILSENGVTLI